MWHIKKLRNILAITFLIWIIAALVLIVAFDLYNNLYPFIVFTMMFLSGIIALGMNEKFLK